MAEREGENGGVFKTAGVFLVGSVENVFGLVGYFEEDGGEVNVSTAR